MSSVVGVESVDDNVERAPMSKSVAGVGLGLSSGLGAEGKRKLPWCYHHCQSSHSHSQSVKNY